MNEIVVAFRGVAYRAGGREVLRDFDLEAGRGETIVLLGPSGAGKTTTLKLTNGMLFPSQGELLVEGRSTTEWNPIALKRRTGYVIQDAGLFPHFTVAENVGLVPRLERWPRKAIDERVAVLLEDVGLPAGRFASRYPRELSGGERQRVGVARALAADPPLLLFDEPFGALDPVTRLELERQFIALRNRFHKTALFVTHDVREALVVGTRIGVLKDGRTGGLMTPREFAASADPEVRRLLACIEWKPEA